MVCSPPCAVQWQSVPNTPGKIIATVGQKPSEIGCVEHRPPGQKQSPHAVWTPDFSQTETQPARQPESVCRLIPRSVYKYRKHKDSIDCVSQVVHGQPGRAEGQMLQLARTRTRKQHTRSRDAFVCVASWRTNRGLRAGRNAFRNSVRDLLISVVRMINRGEHKAPQQRVTGSNMYASALKTHLGHSLELSGHRRQSSIPGFSR